MLNDVKIKKTKVGFMLQVFLLPKLYCCDSYKKVERILRNIINI